VRKAWVLDTETKGTGAEMVPLEKVLKEPGSGSGPIVQPERGRGERRPQPGPKRKVERSATPLPPGHVRKKATGEIGRVRAVDARAGTATVQWLKQGRTSTVPLTAISRR
jgi:hypothetical protein